MGNEASIIRKCTIGVKALHSTDEWSLFDANYGSQQYSVFVFTEDQYFNDITRWKHIRHPNLVKCYEAGLHKGKKYILTEPIKPLRSEKSFSIEKLHNYSKLAGLYNIGEALAFLHQVCGISVNNFTIDSIFISKNDCNEIWKLGSLYWYSSLDSDSEEFFKQLITFHTAHHTIKTLPPEDREISTHRLIRSSKEVHRRDSFAFANLVGEFLYDASKPPKLSEMIMASESPEMINFNLAIKLFVDGANSHQPEQRATIGQLLNDSLFVSCHYLQIRQYFINFSTHSELEKFQFFQTFIERLRTLPDQLLIINIFSMIVSSRVIMSNNFIYNNVMPYLLIPLSDDDHHHKSQETNRNAAILPEEEDEVDEEDNETNVTGDEKVYTLTNGQTIALNPMIATSTYSQYIIPHIANLFCVHDYKIRTLLLLYLPHYGSLIPRTTLRKLILPQILLGIKDSNNQLVALTFRSLAVLVDLFGAVAVFGGSKRSKHFATGIPRGSRLSSETSINDSVNLNDERDNLSTVSGKSSTSNNSVSNYHYKMPAHFISERSSPDGDEIAAISHPMGDHHHHHQSSIGKIDSKINSTSNNRNLIEDDDDDEWPEWEDTTDGMAGDSRDITTNGFDLEIGNLNTAKNGEQSTKQQQPTLNTNDNKSSSIRTTHTKVQTFDIKEIDFKDVANKSEIDNLFMDMEPVFDFRTKSKTTKTQKSSISNSELVKPKPVEVVEEEEEEEPKDFNQKFQPKSENDIDLDIDTIGDDNAWDDDSFDLEDDDDNDNDEVNDNGAINNQDEDYINQSKIKANVSNRSDIIEIEVCNDDDNSNSNSNDDNQDLLLLAKVVSLNGDGGDEQSADDNNNNNNNSSDDHL